MGDKCTLKNVRTYRKSLVGNVSRRRVYFVTLSVTGRNQCRIYTKHSFVFKIKSEGVAFLRTYGYNHALGTN